MKIALKESEFRNLVEKTVRKALTEVYSQEPGADEFLYKVKNEHPDKFPLYYSIVKNKGLEFAKQKYKPIDPDEIAKSQRDVEKDSLNKKLLISFVKSLPKDAPKIWQSIIQKGHPIDSAWYYLEGEILNKYAERYGSDKADIIEGLLTNENYEEYYFSLLDQKFGEHVIEW